ncbi:hypothetical protein LK996_09170 [Lysobacter sp. A6]|uniref:DUF4124 domain-containing protein n=1 Tax=Noviluteimonas lactosilytica TaxID=2888523 RepID=A0ABS8JI27_9GAMM|nr:hypothetical protein [Lysobacter lactosilyticus]MCC8363244.1 hypothetical protein [Lysobacter lactosilyticus]
MSADKMMKSTLIKSTLIKSAPIRFALLAPTLLLALAATDAGAQQKKKLYCWEENGKKVCGDALPAEAAGARRTEFSTKSGRHTAEIAAALTPEERVAAEMAAAEARIRAEADEARFRREMAMAESYATEADLRDSFQERIDLIDESLKASELGVIGLRQSLVALLRQAGENELAGKPITPVSRDNINRQHAELRRRERIFAQQRVQRASLDEELATVLTRYREIKGAGRQRAAENAASGATPPQNGG